MRHVLLVTISALALAGCGSNEAAPGETATAVGWEGVAELRPQGGELEVDPFRRFAESVDAVWERAPEPLVREYLGLDDGSIVVEGEQAILLRDNLEDDSVRAERWVLELERDGELWTLASARWEQRCHQGRGHQDFGNELCL